MAVGPVTLFDRAIPKLVNGLVDLDGHTFKILLADDSQSIDQTFAGTSTDCRKSDLTGEFTTAGGYTAGGATLGSVSLTRTGAKVVFDAADVLWSALTLTDVCYAIIYDDSAANDDLIAFLEVNSGGTLSPAGVDLTITWDATNGIFAIEAV